VDTVAHDFLVKILETPSASGYEEPVQKLVREYLKSCAEKLKQMHTATLSALRTQAAAAVCFWLVTATRLGLSCSILM